MTKEDSPQNSREAPNFEQALTTLETIVHDLEDGELGLTDALGRYEEGVKLLKQCYGLLERAERRIELLSGVDADGNPITQPFDDESSLSLDEKAQSRAKRRSAGGSKPARAAAKPAADPTNEIDEPKELF